MKEFKIYLYRFSGEFIPIIPFLGVFLEKSGLTLADLSIVFFVLSATVLMFEIPTGVLADKIQARTVIIWSRLFKLGAFMIIFLYPSLYGFSAGAFAWGIASALDSGAFQSYLFSYARDIIKSVRFEEIYSRAMTASMLGFLMSALVTTQISWLGFSGLQTIGIGALAFSLFLTFLLPETQKITSSETATSKPGLRPALIYSIRTRLVLLLLVIGVTAGGIKGSLDEYTSILLVSSGASIAIAGFLIFGLEVLKSLGAFFSQWVKVTPQQQIFLLFLFGLSFASIGYYENYIFAFALLAFIVILDAILWIHNDAAIQTHATDQNRATLASLKNFGTELLALLVFMSVWLMGDFINVATLYVILGLTLICVSTIVLLITMIKPAKIA